MLRSISSLTEKYTCVKSVWIQELIMSQESDQISENAIAEGVVSGSPISHVDGESS